MTANITGEITGIKYIPLLGEILLWRDYAHFDINAAPTACVVCYGQNSFALSKWVSPKRSRSYPLSRVYNTLNHSKKITVIPVVKDEGKDGDHDFIQWDTVSLMSLFDVFVIFAHYESAEVSPRNSLKITNQQYNTLSSKINAINQYHGVASDWNLNEIKTNLLSVFDQADQAYQAIAVQTGVTLHDHKELEKIKKMLDNDVLKFMEFSRQKSEQAQNREVKTRQPKEKLQSQTKSKLTITDHLGGIYHLTVDEVETTGNDVVLIESKHSKDSLLPSINDIKDGLCTMALFSNLTNVMVDNNAMKSTGKLVLSSPYIQGNISSKDTPTARNVFFINNKFCVIKRELIKTLFDEANTNNFIVEIRNSQ